jgi:REP element-mobilizing transposase RayT
MPFVKVYIHFVWSTKNREPFLDSSELRTGFGSTLRRMQNRKVFSLI